MSSSRYVLLGLAPARALWFRDLGQWANAGSVPAEFLKCLSAEELRARLSSGRVHSAVLVDGDTIGLDRDLIDRANDAHCPVLVVGGAQRGRDWIALGAHAVLPAALDRRDLLETLAGCATMVGRADRLPEEFDEVPVDGWRAPVVAVTGPGGTGASTVAIALAQGLASDVRDAGAVLLADLRLRAEQAMLHDARDVVPGVQELTEAFRAGHPTSEDVIGLTFGVEERGYRLLLGLRKRTAWSAIRPRAFEAALAALRVAFRTIVADIDPDLEGETEGGSMDIEERHLMARAVSAEAAVVVVVGSPGLKGVYSLAATVTDVLSYGVPGARVLPVINRGPRPARQRAELTTALSAALPPWAGASMATPIFLPERRVDEALRDGVRLPEALVKPLVGAYRAVAARAGDEGRPRQPELITPGSLGSWTPAVQ